ASWEGFPIRPDWKSFPQNVGRSVRTLVLHDFPDAHATVVAGGGQLAGTGSEGQAGNGILVALEDHLFTAGSRVPEGDAGVGCGQALAVGREGHGADFAAVAGQGPLFLAGSEVPELDGTVPAAAGQSLAVGGKGDRVDPGRVAGQRVPDQAGVDVPDLDG